MGGRHCFLQLVAVWGGDGDWGLCVVVVGDCLMVVWGGG
ncbi:hypothetical protein A2U01_0104174, partial [Trifolium medium]|nr:hypothetical protein [Trifolium medium]